jgi:penicillin amidase
MKWFGLFCLVAAPLWTAFLAFGFKSLPPLGPLLEIRGGVWAHRPQKVESQTIPGLKNPVVVAFDSFGVPHFFAEDEADLFLAQGFVMASQRLFQMDLMSRVTAGRLSEWFGSRTLKNDKFFVQFGMREAARRTLERYNENSRIANLMSSFTSGVNAYIRDLKQLPPEYVIIGQRPEPWDNLRIVHMGKQLTFGLAGRSFDHYLSKIQQALGTEKVLDLFPEFTDLDDIVYPTGKTPLRRLEKPEDFKFVTSLKEIPFFPLPAAGNGSNNWAVSAKKSVSGASLMANDTHLGHTLPNIWYEAQLWAPNFNVYGVGLVGIPGIINGLNPQVSWGPTNGTTDVLDYFEVDLSDATSVTDSQQEKIEVRKGPPALVEVQWSKAGVIVHREGNKGLAAGWAGHVSDNELLAIYSLYTSRDLDGCLNAFKTWSAPVQNFVCADRKDVAIQPVGFLPKRPIGNGRFVMQPSENALAHPIAESARPRLIRPQSGIVLSANQRQTGRDDSSYLGWDFEEPFRGTMIRRRLNEQSKLSAEDMIRIQNDSYNLIAELALPEMLKAIAEEKLDSEQKAAIAELREWKYSDLAAARAPAVFYAWFDSLRAGMFGDEYTVQAVDFYPKDTRTIQVLKRVSHDPKHPDSQWVDNKKTEAVETLGDLVTASFLSAWGELRADQGGDISRWSFKAWIKSSFPHVARFPGFGADILAVDGGPDDIRGNKGRHGAVYKIVVEHGDWPKVWIQVPGGNEGDPFSRDYERFVSEWAEGKMRPVQFFKNLEEAKASAVRIVEFKP